MSSDLVAPSRKATTVRATSIAVSAPGSSRWTSTGSGKPEARGRGLDPQRRLRQAVRDLRQVELTWRDVVRRVRVEERRQVLDVVAADAELGLPAAVRADAALGAEVVGRAEVGERADP